MITCPECEQFRFTGQHSSTCALNPIVPSLRSRLHERFAAWKLEREFNSNWREMSEVDRKVHLESFLAFQPSNSIFVPPRDMETAKS